MNKKIQVGDIFEIRTALGLSYAQYTHTHPIYTDVLRIFKTKFEGRPADLVELAADEVQFTVLCAVRAAYKANVLPKIGNVPVREDLRRFPLFRTAINGPNNQMGPWSIWDGENEVRIGEILTEEQKGYPRLMVLNAAAIIDLIEGKVHPALL